MSLVGKFFGNKNAYVDAGTALTFKLCDSLELPGWERGLPVYTDDEVAAIEVKLSTLPNIKNLELGGKMLFTPDERAKIQRMLAGEGLEALAQSQARFTAGISVNWRSTVSTFLKAWAVGLDPMILIDLAEFLIKIDRRPEAKEVVEVVLLFPTYAKQLYEKDDEEYSVSIMKMAGVILAHLSACSKRQ